MQKFCKNCRTINKSCITFLYSPCRIQLCSTFGCEHAIIPPRVAQIFTSNCPFEHLEFSCLR